MKNILNKLLWLVLFVVTTHGHAKDIRDVTTVSGYEVIDPPEFLITHEQPFYGLAFIYNSVQPIYMQEGAVHYIDPEGDVTIPDSASHVGWKTRYQVGLIEKSDLLDASFSQNQLTIHAKSPLQVQPDIGYLDTFEQYSVLKYSHLWGWLRFICIGIEWLLSAINSLIGHWGWSIIVLSVVMKILLFPVGLMTLRLQQNVSRNQTLLAPRLAEIKQKYSGEKAHNEMMAAHKNLGITPFYSLKPLFSNFIQIPILIAIFNVLGEMSVLEGQPFLWISDLSVPDTLFNLGFAIPLFGSGFNLLPILMTFITLMSTIYYKNDLAPAAETKKQKLNLYFMAFAFFVLFYPFPASMVLYWAMANVLQFIQQKTLGN
ncbi:MAG: YidC/Oxa1 family membrane protein insertase [Marinicella sp.]